MNGLLHAACIAVVTTVAPLLAACASPSPGSTALQDDDRLICTDETRTGTLMKSKQCRTAAQVRADSEHAERNANTLRLPAPDQAPR